MEEGPSVRLKVYFCLGHLSDDKHEKQNTRFNAHRRAQWRHDLTIGDANVNRPSTRSPAVVLAWIGSPLSSSLTTSLARESTLCGIPFSKRKGYTASKITLRAKVKGGHVRVGRSSRSSGLGSLLKCSRACRTRARWLSQEDEMQRKSGTSVGIEIKFGRRLAHDQNRVVDTLHRAVAYSPLGESNDTARGSSLTAAAATHTGQNSACRGNH